MSMMGPIENPSRPSNPMPSDSLESTRVALGQDKSPAYGDALRVIKKLERELATATAENATLKAEIERLNAEMTDEDEQACHDYNELLAKTNTRIRELEAKLKVLIDAKNTEYEFDCLLEMESDGRINAFQAGRLSELHEIQSEALALAQLSQEGDK